MRLFLLALLCFISFVSFSQNSTSNHAVGFYTDINGQDVYLYHDKTYEIQDKTFAKAIDLGDKSYAPASYYDNEMNKVTGYIKVSSNSSNISFKKTKGSKREILRREQYHSYTIGIDSFVVFGKAFTEYQNIGIKQSSGNMILRWVKSIDEWSLWFYVGENGEFYYLLSNDLTLKNYCFSLGQRKFRKEFVEYFQYMFPKTAQLVENSKLELSHMRSIFNLMTYEQSLKNNSKIYYDYYDNPSRKPTDNYVVCESINDGYYKVSTYKNNKKTLSKNITIYKSTVLKDLNYIYKGSVQFFDSNEYLYQEYFFNDNGKKLDSIYLFYVNGSVFEIIREPSSKDRATEVFNIEGKQILNGDGDGVCSYYDHINDRNLIIEYKNFNREVIYYKVNEERIYLKTDNSADYKFFAKTADKLDKKLVDFGRAVYDDKAQGFVIYACLVNKKGKFDDIKLIYALHPEIDQLIDKQLQMFKKKREFDPAEHKGETVKQWVLLSFYYKQVHGNNSFWDFYKKHLTPSKSDFDQSYYVPLMFMNH